VFFSKSVYHFATGCNIEGFFEEGSNTLGGGAVLFGPGSFNQGVEGRSHKRVVEGSSKDLRGVVVESFTGGEPLSGTIYNTKTTQRLNLS